MRNIYWLISIAVFMGLLAVVLIFFEIRDTALPKSEVYEQSEDESIFQNMSPEVASIVKEKLALLEKVVENDVIIEAPNACPQNQELSEEEIYAKDQEWIESESLEGLDVCLDDSASETLVLFSKEYPEFVEIGMTDERGLLVAVTNKTSDYYQADEDWWQKAYNGGRGKVYIDEIVYDESANVGSIGVVIPVFDNEEEVLGVMKAVLSIVSIQEALESM